MKTAATLILYLFFFALLPCTRAQQDTKVAKPSFEAIMDTIAQEDVSIADKYRFTQKISHLPTLEQIYIEEALTACTKDETDKARFITLHCMIYNQYSAMGREEEAKQHLDTAAGYADETTNVDALGALYYQTGNHFYKIDEEKKAHENYYKAISYYKQSDTKRFFLNFLYYRIGNAYLMKGDLESLSVLVKEMLAIEFEDPYKIYYNNIYSFVASYYQLKASKEPMQRNEHLKRALHYLGKSIQIYETHKLEAPNPYTAKVMACQNQLMMADIYLIIEPENMETIMDHFKKGEAYLDREHASSLSKYTLIKASIDTQRQKTKKGIADLKEEEKVQLTASQTARDRDKMLLSIYVRLSDIYEKGGNYKEALKYNRLKEQVANRINDKKKYQEVKELNVKYETAEKELEINRLHKEFEVVKYRRILGISASILVVLLLITLFLYERTKKLKKSKEMLLLADRMKEKELEYQAFYNETEQRLVRHYLDGLEAERIRLARELHDNVSNQLVVLKMEVERAEELSPIAQSIAKLHAEVRNISHGLMPPVFQYATLPEIIKDYIYQQNLKGNIRFTAHISPEGYNWYGISSELSTEVYRILQEALGNAIKHARASEVSIMLKVTNSILRLKIADTGRGFETSEQKKGLGLRIIEERAEAIHGTLQIQSVVDRGTVVTLQVSL